MVTQEEQQDRISGSNFNAYEEHAARLGLLLKGDIYDWAQALAYGTPELYVKTIASSEGQGDGDSWIAAFECKDGRYAFLIAGCDYTGWGCQAGGNEYFAPTLEALQRGCMGIDDRRRLGILLPEEQ